MANVLLGNKAVGSIVKLKVNGTARNFIVVNQGRPSSLYDSSCDGTWLLMQDCYEKRQWHSSDVNNYAGSEIHSYLNGTFLGLFDANIKQAIKQVKLPYRPGSGNGKTVNSGADGLSTKIFLLSGTEVGFVHDFFAVEGAKLDYFQNCTAIGADTKRVANLNGSAVYWWLRSPVCGYDYGATSASFVYVNGSWRNSQCSGACPVRPAIILPSTLFVSDDGTVITNTAPTAPGSINVPGQINGGSTITVSWTASTDTEGNLEGYKLERSTDGGSSWSQVYQGAGNSTTNIVQFGTQSVMYRVRAYDSEGLHSGYKTSGQVTVINNTAPTVPGGITVPEAVQGGQPLTVSWGASSDGENNLAGYALERQVDGGDWTAVYSGDQLGFTDAITKGWQTVAYRVRAYDTASAYSGFAVSETRTVNNNTPPVITWDYTQDQNLGVKREGFALAYSVSDEEGDAVSVTEAADGKAWRTFAVQLGAANSLQVQGLDFMRLLNGRHVLSVTASDGAASAVRRVAFTKEVTKASVTLAAPMEADGPISVCVLSVSGFIPADAAYKIEVTNNAKDAAPVWEDCTAEARNGSNYIFGNQTAANGFAFNFRLSAERGVSGVGGYMTSVQGGFQ